MKLRLVDLSDEADGLKNMDAKKYMALAIRTLSKAVNFEGKAQFHRDEAKTFLDRARQCERGLSEK